MTIEKDIFRRVLVKVAAAIWVPCELQTARQREDAEVLYKLILLHGISGETVVRCTAKWPLTAGAVTECSQPACDNTDQ